MTNDWHGTKYLNTKPVKMLKTGIHSILYVQAKFQHSVTHMVTDLFLETLFLR